VIHKIVTSVTSVLLLFAISTNDVCKADVTTIELGRDIPKAHFLHTFDDGAGVLVGVEGDHPIYSWPKGTLLGKPTLVSKQRWKETHADPRSKNRLVAIPCRLYSSFNGLLIVDTNQLVRFEINLSSIRFAHIDDYEISPDNRLLAVTAKDVLIYDMMTMEQVAVLARPKVDCNATSVAFSPDSKHLIVTNGGVPGHQERGGFPRSITRWRMDGFVAEQTVECDFVPLETAVLPDGKTFIANGSVMGLERYDVYTLRRLEPVRFDFAPRGFDFSPDGKCLLIRAEKVGKGMMIVDTTTWDVLARYQTNPDEAVSDAKFLSNNEVVYRLYPETRTIRKWTWK